MATVIKIKDGMVLLEENGEKIEVELEQFPEDVQVGDTFTISKEGSTNYECEECGVPLPDYRHSLCERCQRKKNTKRYQTLAIVILVLGFVGGIILGGNASEDQEFNIVIMFTSWFTTILTSTLILAIYSICYRLDLLVDSTSNTKKTKK